MSMTAVPISIRFVLAPTAASSGKGEASWRAKWCTRKYAPSAPTSSAATASSIDCNSASVAVRTSECCVGVQWPNERNPIFFTMGATSTHPKGIPDGRGSSGGLQYSADADDLVAPSVARFVTEHPPRLVDRQQGVVG